MVVRHFLWLAVVVVFALLSKAHAGAKSDALSACVERLAAGENRLGVRVNRYAMYEALEGLRRYRRGLSKQGMVLLVDYSRNSSQRRANLIDFRRCEVYSNEFAIHGGAIYHPFEQNWGEPNRDGMLKYCVRPDGSRTYMTRPGFYVTAGCHVTAQENWTYISGQCQGVKLIGLERRTAEAMSKGIVLHEHHSISNDNSVKLAGQGCPAFPPGRLARMLRYGLEMRGTLVYVYAPQCR